MGANWFREEYDRRKELMYEHGASGRKFAGRVLQVVTGSTGIDDMEWGVTLFCVHPDDIKDVVYTMRYDEASAVYAEFGTFYVGMVADASRRCSPRSACADVAQAEVSMSAGLMLDTYVGCVIGSGRGPRIGQTSRPPWSCRPRSRRPRPAARSSGR